MITFQKELFIKIMPELPEIFYEHHQETDGKEPESIPLDFHWQVFIHLEAIGILHVMTVRDENKLVGYYMAVITPHLHYKTRLSAVSDNFYLLPEYSGYCWRMIRETEKMLKELKVWKTYLVTKRRPSLRILWKRLGYYFGEEVHTKIL